MLPHKRRPDDLAGDMEYSRDDPIGDGRRFHFYAYYRDEAATLPIDASFHHEWIITGTDWDPAAERGQEGALEAEHKARNQERFIHLIERELLRTNTVLVRRGSQLVRVRPVEPDQT